MTLPNDIKQVFLETLYGNKPVLDFEQWLYADKLLETMLSAEDYLDLISYGYKDVNAKYGLFRLLERHVDKGELETGRINIMLTKALNRDRELPQILRRFYDLFCKGYSFFYNLGMDYGLRVEAPYVNNYDETWEDLSEWQQAALIDSFYPDLETEIRKVISWLDTGKIVLTGIRDEFDYLEYIDNRSELEKHPISVEVASGGFGDKKPWWRFW